MISKIKNKYNLIVGAIVGFILAQLVLAEGYAVSVSIQQKQGIIDYGLPRENIIWVQILAFIIFIGTIVIFNIKRMRRLNLNRLNIYLLIALIVSVFVTVEAAVIVTMILGPHITPKLIEYMQNNYFMALNIGLITIGLGIVIFVVIFTLFINKKVKYITFLTKEVKKIKDEGFGKTIEVKGNDEIAELCESINQMSLELSEKIENEKRIEETKNELITNISHDLKTPLTSIIGYLELINREDIQSEKKKLYSKVAYDKSLRLKGLVNELFEYTKLTSPDIKLNKMKFNISNLLNQIVGESILGFVERDIEVNLDNPYREILCSVDIKLFTRVLENLIKNAEKYSDRNSVFKIQVLDFEDKTEISFINKCEKLAKEDLNKIFEKFYRADIARSDEIEGSGLGLNIAKRIVELHNGKLEVEKDEANIKFKIEIKK
ncbi:ATP-binding protein [uncultured Clostridium sp.]|uniref:HAMP domain-containing sensor histidine kinase n=1 Tax=uncultured Clostridium sp. TaxID=59620 RepID=UPI0026087B70|nr:ATP-binding protein [uncultured Clostridium sp.]